MTHDEIDQPTNSTIPNTTPVVDAFSQINLAWIATLSNRKFFCLSVLLMLALILAVISKVASLLTTDKEMLATFIAMTRHVFNISDFVVNV